MVAIAGRMTVKVCLGLEETNGYTTDAEYFELLMKGLLKPRCENGLVEEVAFDKRQPKRVRYFARWESPGNNQKLSAEAIRESHLRWLFCTQRGFPIMNSRMGGMATRTPCASSCFRHTLTGGSSSSGCSSSLAGFQSTTARKSPWRKNNPSSLSPSRL